MNREEYLRWRNNKDLNLIFYAYYKEKAEERDFEPYDMHIFTQSIFVWEQLQGPGFINKTLGELDRKFVVQELSLDGKILKYI